MALTFEEAPQVLERMSWEKLDNEPPAAWDYFLSYREMGTGRNLSKLARQLDKSRQYMAQLAQKYEWRRRALEYDLFLDKARVDGKQKAIAKVTAQVTEAYELSQQRTLLEVARLGYSDIRNAVTWDNKGNIEFTPSTELDPHTAAAISEVTFTVDKDGNKIPRFKFHNKLTALNLAGQHLNLWQPAVQQTVTINNNYLILLNRLDELAAQKNVVAEERKKIEEELKGLR